jgi:BatD DUF11 like domain
MSFFKAKTIIVVLTLFFSLIGRAQDNIKIILGPDEIGENQAWTIHVSVSNDQLKGAVNFPDIEGFRKRGTSSQSQTSIINGQMTTSQGVIMTYTPVKQGTFILLPFKMVVNGHTISVSGKKIKVGPPAQAQSRDPFRDLFRDPFADPYRNTTPEYVDLKDDAFLALTTGKDEVYVGEGFNATLAFYIAESNKAPLQWHDLGPQISEILKKLRPAACWEENFNIENIEGEAVQIANKGYVRFPLYQANFYPLNADPVVFPSVGLEMIKFKVAKNPSFFGQNRQEDFKTYVSKIKTVKVKELPPHPLRDMVAVGDYRLEEKISSTAGETGKSLGFDFIVTGEGNISAIEKPLIEKNPAFDFFDPNVRQNISRDNGRVIGSKAFNYFIIPQEPGEYPLKDYVQWVFFNPKLKKYDTLKSQVALVISGESKKNESIVSSDGGSFYDRIATADNTLQSTAINQWMKLCLNIFLVLMLGVSAWLLFRK